MPNKAHKLTSVVLPTILLVQTLVFASMGGFNYWSAKQTYYEKLKEDIAASTQRLHNNLPGPLWNYNENAVNNILAAEISEEFIEAISIKIDGVIVYQIAKSSSQALDFSLSKQQQTAMARVTPSQLFYRGEDGSGDVGELFILSSDSALKDNLKKLSNNLIIQSIILNSSLACLILYILHQFIIKPIKKTKDRLRDIVQGGHDLSKRLDENAIGELGELAKDYNRLACYITLIMDDIKSKKINLEAIFNNALNGIILFDQSGNITNINPAAYKLFGHKKDSLLYKNIGVLIDNSSATEIFNEIDKRPSDTNNGFINHTREIVGIKHDGCQFPIALSISRIEELESLCFIALIKDISNQKKLEKETAKALEKAQESAKLKSEFLASMSHEIRTPMNGVLGMLDLILQGDLNLQQQHYAHLARSSAQALLGIINDILDFSKIEAGKLNLEIIDFDLNRLLGEFAESIAVKAQEKGLELLLDIKDVNISTVRGDPGRVRQVLNNIVGNAIKFTQEGEILIKASLTDQGSALWQLHCHIRDTGIGIAADKQGLLFESFSQVDASTTRQYGGTGLGLAIVKQLCLLMHGDVQVDSEPGQGSCFSVTLNLGKSPDAQIITPPVAIDGRSILLVDSNHSNVNLLHAQLTQWRAQVSCAHNVQQALAILAQQPQMDLLIIARNMLDNKGIELGRQLNSHYPQLKKVIMSSIVAPADAECLETLRFITQFPKPTTTQDLFRVFELAFGDPTTTDTDTPSTANLSPPSGCRKKQILLVEDNLINQEIALVNLEMLGFASGLAENGREAITMLKNAPQEARYDLVLMDCQMPEMDGYQATQAIRKGDANNPQLGKNGYCATIPIIAMTANAMKGDKEKCIAAGMDDYMTKPIDPGLLQEKIYQWLGGQQSEAEH
ncbi:MAG: response regulator [Cellvibrionaceae bacterium]|nr:response regulator [Cellvibrionaceae bacterium]